jgi:hypothetical protein
MVIIKIHEVYVESQVFCLFAPPIFFISEMLRERPFNLKGGEGVMDLTLGYITKTLNQIIFFLLHQNQNIFFSNIGNQNIFFRKKP